MIARIALLCSLLFSAGTLGAAEVGGVRIPDAVKVGGADLVLNGAGVRTRAVFKVYVGALYLPEKKTTANDALAQKGPKRVALHLLRDLTAEQLGGALNDGLAANLSDAERAQFKAQIDELKATMEAVGAAKEKSVVTLDFAPDGGTRVALDGTTRGKPIPGEDFYRALLRIWIGDKPVDRTLKAAMLGQPG
ncbi:MAG: chalcone isomerase family protein [Burkholderiales bacterium]|nr:chalcone isomerase family protein [Burkholderiales bacterium]